MGRRFQCGHELTSLTEYSATGGTPTLVSGVGVPRSGTYALRTAATASTCFARYHDDVTDRSVLGHMGAAFKVETLPSATNTIVRFQTATNNACAQIRLTAAGKIQLFDNNGTQVGSDSAATLSADGLFHLLELKCDASSSPGSVALWLDNVLVASGANQAQSPWSRLTLGVISSTTAAYIWDDVKLNDGAGSVQTGRVGSGKIIHIRPNGAGTDNAWNNTANTAGSTSNYTLVNETSPNSTTNYVQSGTVGNKDYYILDDTAIGASDTVNCVMVGIQGRNNTADATTACKVGIKTTGGGTLAQSAAIIFNGASFGLNSGAEPRTNPLIMYVDPDGAAWTQASLDNACQVGLELTAVGTNRIQISAIWVSVDYTPLPNATAILTATETDSPFAFTRTKSHTAGISAETDSAFAFTRTKSKTVGIAAETDSAFAFTKTKQHTIGIATQTNAAQPLTGTKSHSLGTATETETALALTPSRQHTLGIAAQTSTAFTFTGTKSHTAGIATETQAAQALSGTKSHTLGTATETETAFILPNLSQHALGIAGETEAAQPLTGSKSGTLGTSNQANAAQPLTGTYIRALSQSSETETAQSLTVTKTHALGQTLETEATQPFTGTKTRALGTANQADMATPLAGTKTHALGIAPESSTAQALSASKSGAVAAASSSEAAQSFTVVSQQTLGIATETGTAFGFSGGDIPKLLTATETETAFILTVAKSGVLGIALEADSATTFTGRKNRTLTAAAGTNTALTFTGTKSASVSLSSETETALTLSAMIFRILVAATETEAAQPFTALKSRTIGTANGAEAGRPFVGSKTAALGMTGDTSTTFPMTALKSRTITVASESDQALTLATTDPGHTLGIATETEEALPLTGTKTRSISTAPGTDTSRALTALKSGTLGVSEGVETSVHFTGLKLRSISFATDTGTALHLSRGVGINLHPAVETGAARPLQPSHSGMLPTAFSVEIALTLAGATGDTRRLEWHVYDRRDKKAMATYDVHRRVTHTVGMYWNALAIATPKTLAATWSVRQRPAKTTNSLWDLYVRALMSRNSNWMVYKRVPGNLAMDWAVHQTISHTITASYNVLAQADPMMGDADWSVFHTTGGVTAVLAWNAFVEKRHTVELSWALRGSVTPVQRAFSWHVYGLLSLDHAVEWAVAQRLARGGTATWAVIAHGSPLTVDLSWKVGRFEIDPDYPLLTSSRVKWQRDATRQYQYGTGTPEN